MLGFSAASRRYLEKHPGQRWLRRAVYFALVYLLLSAAFHTICQSISGHPLPSWASDGLSEAVLAALCTFLAVFFAAEAAPALKGLVHLLFA